MACTDEPIPSMDSSSSLFFLKQQLMNILLISACIQHVTGCYPSIFSFGNSLADTGNLLLSCQQDNRTLPFLFSLPYGESYFHRPTGRCSDGRLVIDFIAECLGLPLLQPYLATKNQREPNLQRGVNFAIAGATALDIKFFEERGIQNPYTNLSLGTQLGWFKEMLPLLCNTPSSCSEILGSSLFLVGEIGGNDYNYPLLLQNRSIEEIRTFVPIVVSVIASAVNELIELGAKTLIVPGDLPLGCLAAYLTLFESPNKEDYDSITGCLNRFNEFAEYHNEQLKIELNWIQELQPHATIIYADYYNDAMRLYHSPSEFGFTGGALRACCGGGGINNFNSLAQCGYPLANTCVDPSKYVSWDGVHFTEAAYKWMSIGLLEGGFTIPPLNTSCFSVCSESTRSLNMTS